MPVLDRSDTVGLALPYRPPLDWDALLAFLGARATPAVECVDKNGYARTMRIDGHAGIVRVTQPPRIDSERNQRLPAVLHLAVSTSLDPVIAQVNARVRQLFDLDADSTSIESHLSAGGFAPLRRLRRGLRVPGTVDGFELAVRAILGQQVSVKGATTLMSRLTAAFGESLDCGDPHLWRLSATAERVADASVSSIKAIGLPTARAATIHSVAREVASGALRIDSDANVGPVTQQLLDITGIGPWTTEYIAMRAMHWPDAFPASDLGLRRNAGNLTTAALLRVAERWRPWRAYAAMQLWMANT